MATGGCGDVLTGLITALLCQGLEPLEAARLGVHAHGLAGDLAAAELGQVALIARDLIRFLPQALKQLE
jgi:NAD(P)H-hydrate epimerase